MPVIVANTGVITQINVFEVRPGMQDALITLLSEAAEACRSDVPRWLSASLHLSLDGRRVINYAQAEDQAAMRRIFEYLAEHGWIERNSKLAVANPGLYTVVRTLEP